MDPHRVQQLAAGQSSLEDVASSRLRAVLDTGAYSATAGAAALADFDITVITAPTPLRDGVPDLTYIKSCARTLGEHLRPCATVVLESTTYPGTGRGLPLDEPRPGRLRPRPDHRTGRSDRPRPAPRSPTSTPPAGTAPSHAPWTRFLSLQFSYSYSSPAQLGDYKDAFERNLRQALTEFNPDDTFDEVVRTEAIIATRP